LDQIVVQDRGIPYGIVQTGQPVHNGVPTVRAGDIKNYVINKSVLKLVDNGISAKYPRTVLNGGEVLLSIRGTVGNAAVAPTDLVDCNISREVALIPVHTDFDPWFIAYFLSSPVAQAFLSKHVKGVAQSGVNLRDLRRLPVPCVDKDIQRGLVQRIGTAFGWLSGVESDYKQVLRLLDYLENLTLKIAFAGKLLPQDPSDEPASVLLTQILADRSKNRVKYDESRESRSVRPTADRGRRMGKKRSDVVEGYLADILRELGGSAVADKLWLHSEMDIDEFYKQLRNEIAMGQIREGVKKTLLELENAA
jgi:type I restriction enzyme S subunit